MVPLTAVIAVLAAARRTGRAGLALVAVVAARRSLAITVDVDLSPRLQRGDWRGPRSRDRPHRPPARAITTVELGSAPLEYYLPRAA